MASSHFLPQAGWELRPSCNLFVGSRIPLLCSVRPTSSRAFIIPLQTVLDCSNIQKWKSLGNWSRNLLACTFCSCHLLPRERVRQTDGKERSRPSGFPVLLLCSLSLIITRCQLLSAIHGFVFPVFVLSVFVLSSSIPVLTADCAFITSVRCQMAGRAC